MNSANEIGIKTPGHQRPPTDLTEAAGNSSGKLRNGAIIAAGLLLIGAVAGIVPRWRHQAQLRAETRELSKLAVAVVRPVPGKEALSPLRNNGTVPTF